MQRQGWWILATLALLVIPWVGQAASQAELDAIADQKFYRVSLKDAEDAVAKALQEKGAGDKVSAMVIGKRNAPLYAYDRPMEVVVKTLDFDEKSGKWSANLLFSSEGEVLSAMPASGRYEALYEVPVLNLRLREGEEIRKDYIDWVEIPASRMRKDMVLTEEALIGKMPRRIVSAGRPVRSDELRSTPVLKKGGVVTMVYDQGAMQIKTTGVALDEGAVGDMVRVRNSDSNITVRATVVSADRVTVRNLTQTDETSRKEGLK